MSTEQTSLQRKVSSLPVQLHILDYKFSPLSKVCGYFRHWQIFFLNMLFSSFTRRDRLFCAALIACSVSCSVRRVVQSCWWFR